MKLGNERLVTTFAAVARRQNFDVSQLLMATCIKLMATTFLYFYSKVSTSESGEKKASHRCSRLIPKEWYEVKSLVDHDYEG